PDASIDSGSNPAAGSTTSQTSVHMVFSASGASSFECSRDGGSFNSCSSPEDYTVGDGSHSFRVRALDSLGNVGATDQRNWTVDTTGPNTSIDSGPSGTTNSTNANFTFSATGGATGFECSRDGGTFNPCNSPESY